jgi:hypothetical protein
MLSPRTAHWRTIRWSGSCSGLRNTTRPCRCVPAAVVMSSRPPPPRRRHALTHRQCTPPPPNPTAPARQSEATDVIREDASRKLYNIRQRRALCRTQWQERIERLRVQVRDTRVTQEGAHARAGRDLGKSLAPVACAQRSEFDSSTANRRRICASGPSSTRSCRTPWPPPSCATSSTRYTPQAQQAPSAPSAALAQPAHR